MAISKAQKALLTLCIYIITFQTEVQSTSYIGNKQIVLEIMLFSKFIKDAQKELLKTGNFYHLGSLQTKSTTCCL